MNSDSTFGFYCNCRFFVVAKLCVYSQNVFHFFFKIKMFFSAGGLVTAVAPVVIDNDGLWVGWTGLYDFNTAFERIPESEPDDRAPTAGLLSSQAIPVSVQFKLFDSYYNGCCNETFWPLFHSMPDRAIFNSDTWNVRIFHDFFKTNFCEFTTIFNLPLSKCFTHF